MWALLAAKLVILSAQTTVIHYPTMQKCLAAKAALERQSAAQEQHDRERGVYRSQPVVYCLPD